MSSPQIIIEFTPATIALMERAKVMPLEAPRVIARGIDSANQLVIADITSRRMTGKGSYPVEEGKLGVVTNRLRSSLRNSKASVEGNVITGAIGTNVRYAGIHEFGGVIQRTTKDGVVRLRLNRQSGGAEGGTRSGGLMRQEGFSHLARFAKKTHKLVREVKYKGGKSYTITMPARAPIGHGIADNTATYDREINKQLSSMFTGTEELEP